MAAILLSLAACQGRDPVDEDAVAPPDGLAGDMAATGLAAPGNSAARQAVDQAALPPASGGLRWEFRGTDRLALFGPPGSPAFSVQCQRQREGQSRLIFIRHLPPSSGAQATLSFTGNGQAASVPIAGISSPGGIGGEWRATVPPNDIVRDVAEIFAGPGPVELSVSGTAPLVVPASAAPRRVLADCLGG